MEFDGYYRISGDKHDDQLLPESMRGIKLKPEESKQWKQRPLSAAAVYRCQFSREYGKTGNRPAFNLCADYQHYNCSAIYRAGGKKVKTDLFGSGGVGVLR